MSNTIKGAHIFNAGKHNGSGANGKREWTEGDLDGMVSAFNALKQAGRVPLKFGHNDAQAMTDGKPALGWIGNMWREGKKLMADMVDVPTAVYSMIQKGLYKFTSVEILNDAEHDGKKFPFVIDAVALLGADPPAVSGLADLQRLTLSRGTLKFAEAITFTRESQLGDSNDMEKAELQAAIAAALTPIQTQITAVQTELVTVKGERDKFKADHDKLLADKVEGDKKAAADKIKMSRDKVTQVLEGAVLSGKIKPAKRDAFAKSLGVADDARVVLIDMADVEAMCEITSDEAAKVITARSAFSRDPKKGGKGDQSAMHGTDNGNSNVPKSRDVVKTCMERAAKRGTDVFAEFVQEVAHNPELGEAILAQTFETAQIGEVDAR